MEGTVILDANTLWRLEDPSVRDRVAHSLRAADLIFRPTAINLLEAIRTSRSTLRSRLLAVIRGLWNETVVRPLPREILALTASAMARNAPHFEWAASGYEWMLRCPDLIGPQHVAFAAKYLDEGQAEFDDMHKVGRSVLRPYLKEHGQRDPWGDIPTFLDVTWTQAKHLDTYIARTWSSLGAPGTPEIGRVLRNEAWRIYYEGMGGAVYERAILSQSPSPVHLSDIRQLIYLAGSRRRILVTDDKDLQRVADAVLRGRYAGSRVIGVQAFLDLAS
jgi:hypothetical protein